jgi:outer membrane receptor for ferrienterochelin and colicins
VITPAGKLPLKTFNKPKYFEMSDFFQKNMLKGLFIRLIGLMGMLLAGSAIFGQQASILVIDSKTKEPVPYATVCFGDPKSATLKYAVTDMHGKVPNEVKEITRVTVTFVGYETLVDTIKRGMTETLELIPAVLNMDEVVITAQYAPEKADRSIYKINVINSRQIEQKAATNLSDLLSTESNMRLSQGGVLGTSLSMQGLSGENVKFLVDGVPVVGRLNGNIDLNQLNLYNVDHVEVIEGPMSVIYGSNAIAGVVNIITKENRNSSLTAYANAYLETVGVYNFNAGSSITRKSHHLSLDLARNFFDGYTTADTVRSLQWKPRLQYNIDSYYLYTGGKTRVKLSIQYFNESLQDKGDLQKPYYETALDNYFHTIRVTSKAEASYTISANRQISMVTAYSTYDRTREVYHNDLTVLEKNMIGGDTTSVGSYLLRAWYNRNYPGQKLNYQVGFDGNLEKDQGERILNGQQQIGDYAGFLSMKYNPIEKLSLQPGARFIYNTKYDAPVVYSLNVKYGFTPNTSLRATYARGFRAPSIKELYLDFVDINHNLQGNPDLKAEYSNNANLNFSYNREAANAYINTELGLFYNYVHNTIWLFQEGSDLTTYTYGNVSTFISQGIQANATVSFYPTLTLKGGISHVGRKFPDNTSEGSDNQFNYSTDFNAMATYNFVKYDVSLTANFKYTGKYPLLTPDGSFNDQYIDGYSNLDMSVMKSFLQNRFSVTAGGKNLLDVKDVGSAMVSGGAHSGGGDGSSRVAWGRTAFVKLNYNFKKF